MPDAKKMMKKLLVVPVVLAVALPAFSGQQKPQPATPNQPAPQAATPQAPNQQASIPEPMPVLSVPPGYHYEARGRRDPFVNPIPKPLEEEVAPPVIRPPGLKGLLMSDAKLLGVVTSKDLAMNKVIIQAPGNKTYFAARGDNLWDAVIKDIQPDAVVFTVISPVRANGQPVGGQPVNREIVRKVRPTTGEYK